MKKVAVFFFLLFALLQFQDLNAQSTYIKNRWSLKFAYADYQTSSYIIAGSNYRHKHTGNYQVELDYGLSDIFELGVYGGFSLWGNRRWLWQSTSFINTLYNYGLSANMQILPIFLETDNLRVETYLTGKIGGAFYHDNYSYGSINGYQLHNNYNVFEYGLGLGAAYYPFEKLGFFTEYSFGKYYTADNDKFRIGLTYKLK